MLAAAAVEWYRLKLFHEGKVLPALGGSPGHSILSHRDGSGIVDMNVFWQVPQYLLVGLSEVRICLKGDDFHCMHLACESVLIIIITSDLPCSLHLMVVG